MHKGKIDVYSGIGRILGPSIFSPMPGTISVEMADGSENEMLVPNNVIIATGSRPRMLDGLHVDGQTIFTSNEYLEIEKLPKSVLIVGGGVIGIEWASMLNDFDVDVTIIENSERILPTEDAEISAEMAKILKKRGVTIITNAEFRAEQVNVTEVTATVTLPSGEQYTARAIAPFCWETSKY